MEPVTALIQAFIGIPTSAAETAILYAVAAMTYIVIFDTVAGLFRMIGKSLARID